MSKAEQNLITHMPLILRENNEVDMELKVHFNNKCGEVRIELKAEAKNISLPCFIVALQNYLDELRVL